MKLNIYLISHPLIQNLSNITSNPILPSHNTHQAFRHLGLFMIYESIRKWMRIYKLIIKNTKGQKEIIVIDPKESYTIIFNDIQYLNMFQEVQLLLPNIHLKLITFNEMMTIEKDPSICTDIDFSTKIIIVNYEIDIYYIQHILKYLIHKNKIDIHQICLTCIKCATNQLIQISKEYNNLNIYTANIVKN